MRTRRLEACVACLALAALLLPKGAIRAREAASAAAAALSGAPLRDFRVRRAKEWLVFEFEADEALFCRWSLRRSDGRTFRAMDHVSAGHVSRRFRTGEGRVVYELEVRLRKYVPSGSFGGPGDTPGRFRDPCGVACGSRGRIYVLERGNDRVQCFAPDYTQLFSFGGFGVSPRGSRSESSASALNDPGDIMFHRSKLLYVVDRGASRVVVYDESGRYMGKFGEGTLDKPACIASDSSNETFVTDPRKDCIFVFSRKGALIRSFGRYGWGRRQFNKPVGVAVDAHDNIYVAERGNRRIQILSPSLGRVKFLQLGRDKPGRLFVDHCGYLYVSCLNRPAVLVFDVHGRKVRELGPSDGCPMSAPRGMAETPDGRLLIADSAADAVLVFKVEETSWFLRGKAEGTAGTRDEEAEHED